MGAQAFGAGMSTVGAFLGAKMQKDSLRSQARLDEINARIMDGNARAAIERGTWEESRVKMRGTTLKNSQAARYAANGIDVAGSNSALAVMTGTDVITEVDANQTRANAIREAWGQRFKAGDYRRAATSKRASAAGISPFTAGFTSLIEGAGQVASSWYSLSKQGGFERTANTAKLTDSSGYGSGTKMPAAFETSDGLLAWGW